MGGKTSKNRRVPDSSRWIFGFFSKPVWEPQRYQPWYPPSQTDWPASVGRNYTEAVCPGRFSHPSDCPGQFRRWIKTQNCRVGQTGGRNEFILVGARGRRPLWSPPWVPMTFGRQCEVLKVLFFLIFYSLFGPCPARPALSGRPFSESDWSGRFPFSESDRPGRFCRVIKTRNRRVGRTDKGIYI